MKKNKGKLFNLPESTKKYLIDLLAFAESKDESVRGDFPRPRPKWNIKEIDEMDKIAKNRYTAPTAAEAAIKLGITFPEFQIENKMKANGDLTPWKRFVYLFCPNLKRRARVQALLDLQRKEENFNNVVVGSSIWPDELKCNSVNDSRTYGQRMRDQRKEQIEMKKFKKDYFCNPPFPKDG